MNHNNKSTTRAAAEAPASSATTNSTTREPAPPMAKRSLAEKVRDAGLLAKRGRVYIPSPHGLVFATPRPLASALPCARDEAKDIIDDPSGLPEVRHEQAVLKLSPGHGLVAAGFDATTRVYTHSTDVGSVRSLSPKTLKARARKLAASPSVVSVMVAAVALLMLEGCEALSFVLVEPSGALDWSASALAYVVMQAVTRGLFVVLRGSPKFAASPTGVIDMAKKAAATCESVAPGVIIDVGATYSLPEGYSFMVLRLPGSGVDRRGLPSGHAAPPLCLTMAGSEIAGAVPGLPGVVVEGEIVATAEVLRAFVVSAVVAWDAAGRPIAESTLPSRRDAAVCKQLNGLLGFVGLPPLVSMADLGVKPTATDRGPLLNALRDEFGNNEFGAQQALQAVDAASVAVKELNGATFSSRQAQFASVLQGMLGHEVSGVRLDGRHSGKAGAHRYRVVVVGMADRAEGAQVPSGVKLKNSKKRTPAPSAPSAKRDKHAPRPKRPERAKPQSKASRPSKKAARS